MERIDGHGATARPKAINSEKQAIWERIEGHGAAAKPKRAKNHAREPAKLLRHGAAVGLETNKNMQAIPNSATAKNWTVVAKRTLRKAFTEYRGRYTYWKKRDQAKLLKQKQDKTKQKRVRALRKRRMVLAKPLLQDKTKQKRVRTLRKRQKVLAKPRSLHSQYEIMYKKDRKRDQANMEVSTKRSRRIKLQMEAKLQRTKRAGVRDDVLVHSFHTNRLHRMKANHVGAESKSRARTMKLATATRQRRLQDAVAGYRHETRGPQTIKGSMPTREGTARRKVTAKRKMTAKRKVTATRPVTALGKIRREYGHYVKQDEAQLQAKMKQQIDQDSSKDAGGDGMAAPTAGRQASARVKAVAPAALGHARHKAEGGMQSRQGQLRQIDKIANENSQLESKIAKKLGLVEASLGPMADNTQV